MCVLANSEERKCWTFLKFVCRRLLSQTCQKGSEGNQRTQLCLNFLMTMIILKGVSRDANVHVLANFH